MPLKLLFISGRVRMEYKDLKLPSISESVRVREDGEEIIFKGKKVNLCLIKSKKQRKGFYQVSIEGKQFYVHRLVAQAYVPNPKPVSYKMILHKDCDSLNNHYSNLHWGTPKMIMENRIKNGVPGGIPNQPDSYRSSSKISYEEAMKICERLKNGEYAKNICKEYGVSEMSIARIRKRYIKQPASIRYPKNVKETVLKLLEKHRPHELVKSTGIKYHTLYRWSKEVAG